MRLGRAALPGDDELRNWLRQALTWLPRQRWYGAAGTALSGLRVRDCAALGHARWMLLDAHWRDGRSAVFQAVARRDQLQDMEVLPDAEVRAELLRLILSESTLPGRGGRFAAQRLAPLEHGAPPFEVAGSRVAGAEQSNTSLIYLDAAGEPAWILKLFRRVTPGTQPEIEAPLALARGSGFRAMAAPAGMLQYLPARGGEAWALGVLQPYIANQGDAWDWVLRQLRAGEAAAAALLPELARLGERTAELHLALAGIADEAFAPEPITAADIAQWRGRLAVAAGGMAAELRAAGLAPDVAARLQKLSPEQFPLAGLEGRLKIRHHGDYHLGQVLRTTAGDFAILDFEGEPARPLSQRRQKTCGLKDVAGMLRSFSYAAHGAPAPPGWEAAARAAFWEAYAAVLHSAPPALAPAEPVARAEALRFFECEKAVYELGYELHHRPAWVELPLAGLRGLLG